MFSRDLLEYFEIIIGLAIGFTCAGRFLRRLSGDVYRTPHLFFLGLFCSWIIILLVTHYLFSSTPRYPLYVYCTCK